MLTKESVELIPAGHVLDTLVALRVFGGREHYWARDLDGRSSRCLWCSGRFERPAPEPSACSETPPYSTDAFAASLVLAKLRGDPEVLSAFRAAGGLRDALDPLTIARAAVVATAPAP